MPGSWSSTLALNAKLTCLGGCWGEPFQSVVHLEEGTMPGKVSAAIMSFGILYSSVSYSVQFLADWVDSWWGLFPIGELSCH